VGIAWYLEDGDDEYFKGKIGDIIYNIKEMEDGYDRANQTGRIK
jgi:hypothetical protein